MVDMTNVIEQRISNNEKSICEKCSHRRVCSAIDNQPCFECNQFEPEVVRCKDCKYYTSSSACIGIMPGYGFDVEPDDFCSGGERKE